MEEQNTGEANVEHDRPDQPDRVEGVAKVIRAGGDAGGRRLMRAGGGGNGAADAAAAAGKAAAGVAEPAMRAGQAAAEGAHAVTEAAEEVAEDAEVQTGQALKEWAECARRAYLRNTRAMIDLTQCRTVYGLLQWQGNLLTETASDVLHTNSRILRLVLNKA